MHDLLERLELIEAAVDEDLLAFNTALAKKLKGLKRDVRATKISQSYRGTGGQKHRRQIWVYWGEGGRIDIWVDSGFLNFGGISSTLPDGREISVSPREIQYDEKSVDKVYSETVAALKKWLALSKKAK